MYTIFLVYLKFRFYWSVFFLGISNLDYIYVEGGEERLWGNIRMCEALTMRDTSLIKTQLVNQKFSFVLLCFS